MKRVLLDTSAYSAYLRGSTGIRKVLREAQEIVFTPVVIGELLGGFKRGAHEARNRTTLEEFLSAPRVAVRELDAATSEFYAAVLDHLRRAGSPVPTNDIWIAASAMQHGLTLITTDRHFQAMPQILVRLFPAMES